MEKESNETFKPEDWWVKFKKRSEGDRKLMRVFEILDKADQTGSRKLLNNTIVLIEALNPQRYSEEKNEFMKRVRTLEKRIERQVSDNFGLMLKYLREQSNHSLAEIGEMTGISPSYINRIEAGQRKAPSFPIIEKLAKALNVPINTLIAAAGTEVPENMGGGKVQPKTISELILSNSVTLSADKKKLSVKEKEKLVSIIDYISAIEWKANKSKELIHLIELLDEFK